MQYHSVLVGHFLLCFLCLDGIHMVLGQCSGSELALTATKELQYFTSPGYNDGTGSYQSNMNCSWVIDSGNANAKTLIFVESLNIMCSGDVITIYDGSTSSATVLKDSLCGSTPSAVYSSTQRYVRFEFSSDGSSQATGFKTAYLGTLDLSGSGCTSTQTLTPTATPQYLTSPEFPSLYSVDANCRWIVTASGGGVVKVEIVFIDVEKSTNCAFDSLEIYDGTSVCSDIKSDTICSPHPNGITRTYISNGTSILIKFASDRSLSYHGFILKYSSISTSSVLPSSSTQASEDNFNLGLAIGFGGGAGAAFLLVATVIFLKHLCKKSKKHMSPRVHNLSVTSSSSRTNSISSSSISGDSGSRLPNGSLCSTPISPNTSVVLHLQRLQKRNSLFP